MTEPLNDIEAYMDSLPEESSSEEKSYDSPLYKKWFKTKSQSGFLSISPWNEALKIKIDIGKTSPNGNLISSTKVFVNAIDFSAYLKSIVNGTAASIYSANPRLGVPTDEGFASYGGAVIDGAPVSRIFKAHYWGSSDNYDSSSFVWKTGHFKANKSSSGAFIPDLKSPITVDSIKVTRQDISSISYILDISMISYVANNPEWRQSI